MRQTLDTTTLHSRLAAVLNSSEEAVDVGVSDDDDDEIVDLGWST